MKRLASLCSLAAAAVCATGLIAQQPPNTDAKPNILVIWGDDIGTTNISAYSDGVMGYETPNIDRVANEGLRFLHYYAEQSCTAGRAAFLTGQHGLRTGLTKVGFPGAPMGMSQLDPSIGALLNNGVKSARSIFYYSDDDGHLVSMPQGDYKYVFSEQRSPGTMQVWAEPFTTLRLQKIFNLFQDPFERADITSNTFWDWQMNHVGTAYGMMDEVFKFAATFKEFPPRSFPPSFNPATVLEGTMREFKAERKLHEMFPLAAPAGKAGETSPN